jgi:hypothetical protein
MPVERRSERNAKSRIPTGIDLKETGSASLEKSRRPPNASPSQPARRRSAKGLESTLEISSWSGRRATLDET